MDCVSLNSKTPVEGLFENLLLMFNFSTINKEETLTLVLL